MARSPKPTLDDIDRWRKELKPYWKPAEDKAKDSYESYHNEHEVEPPGLGIGRVDVRRVDLFDLRGLGGFRQQR